MARTVWEEVYRAKPMNGFAQSFLVLCFWVWGFAGFAMVFLQFASTMAKTSEGVGVGSSSFLAAIALVWVGGLVFFGLGALLAGPNFKLVQAIPHDIQLER